MLRDLMEHHLRKGMTYHQLVSMLGAPDYRTNRQADTIGYEVTVEYANELDPVKGKILRIALSKDSLIQDYWLEEWDNDIQ